MLCLILIVLSTVHTYTITYNVLRRMLCITWNYSNDELSNVKITFSKLFPTVRTFFFWLIIIFLRYNWRSWFFKFFQMGFINFTSCSNYFILCRINGNIHFTFHRQALLTDWRSISFFFFFIYLTLKDSQNTRKHNWTQFFLVSWRNPKVITIQYLESSHNKKVLPPL